MAEPLRRDLVARRNAPFAEAWPFTVEATGDPVDFAGSTVTMQVRLYGAQPGTALVDLVQVGTLLTEGLIASSGQVTVYIDAATLFFLPRGKEGQSDRFEYDLKVKLAASAVAEIWQRGVFTLKPGVTDRLTLLVAGGNYLVAGGDYLIAG